MNKAKLTLLIATFLGLAHYQINWTMEEYTPSPEDIEVFVTNETKEPVWLIIKNKQGIQLFEGYPQTPSFDISADQANFPLQITTLQLTKTGEATGKMYTTSIPWGWVDRDSLSINVRYSNPETKDIRIEKGEC